MHPVLVVRWLYHVHLLSPRAVLILVLTHCLTALIRLNSGIITKADPWIQGMLHSMLYMNPNQTERGAHPTLLARRAPAQTPVEVVVNYLLGCRPKAEAEG